MTTWEEFRTQAVARAGMIVEALGGQRHAVATALSKLKLCGAVANDTRGVWRKVSNNG